MHEIDKEKGVNCGICSDVCLYGSIIMTAYGPTAPNDICMKCGHCVAYYPTGAFW